MMHRRTVLLSLLATAALLACGDKPPPTTAAKNYKLDKPKNKPKQISSQNLSKTENDLLKKARETHLKLQERLADEKANSQPFIEKIPEKVIISYQEAIEKYGIYKIFSRQKLEDSILVFLGDVRIKGEMNEQWFNDQSKGMKWENSLYGMLIVGNLIIEGDLIDDEYIELHVTQNLICDYVFSHNGHIRVKGNADIKYGAYGKYNDGSLVVDGQTKIPYVLDDFEHHMDISRDCIWIGAGEGTSREDVYIDTEQDSIRDAQKLFIPAVWNEETDEFSINIFWQLVRQGNNPFIEI